MSPESLITLERQIAVDDVSFLSSIFSCIARNRVSSPML